MSTSYKNRLVCTVSAVASSGLGAFTVSTAAVISGEPLNVTFAAGDDGKSFDVFAKEGTAWEMRVGCVYTHSGTSLSRGTLESSSTGSAIAFTAAAILTSTPSAAKFQALELAMQGLTSGGRPTLESGVPVSVNDQIAKTTIYYTPYLHNVCPLWDGVGWLPVVFAETSLAVGTVTSGANYDIFAYLSGGSLALEKLIWTNDTTRATAVTLQDGRLCKSGDKTRFYVGTFRSTSTTTTEDSAQNRFLYSEYNQASKSLVLAAAASAHTYSSAIYRSYNADNTKRVQWVQGIAKGSVNVNYSASTYCSSGAMRLGVGYNSTTSESGLQLRANTTSENMPSGSEIQITAVGLNYVQLIEYVDAGTGNYDYGAIRGGTLL